MANWQIDPDTKSATMIRTTTCNRCHRKVLIFRWDVLPYVADEAHLSPLGEIQALMFRLRTFHIVESTVTKRKAHHIATEPEPKWGYIVREHRCGLPAPTQSALQRPRVTYDGPPDF